MQIQKRLIAICGIDGSGKSTLISGLERRFADMNIDFLITEQPSKLYRSDDLVRKYMKYGGDISETKQIALLSAYDRLKHQNEIIMPAIDSGKIVISHRHIYATLAIFQKRGLSKDTIEEINSFSVFPEITFLLDIPGIEAAKRILTRGGEIRKEEKCPNDLEAIRQMYLSLVNDSFIVVYSLKSETQILDEVFQVILNRVLIGEFGGVL